MSALRVLVADDEPLARARLLRLLAQFPDVQVVAECGSGQEAVEQMHARAPDAVFLDIQMPDLDGFDVLDSLPRERRPAVVFVTAFSEHAVRAFEARALDYLLKPVSGERLRQALERLRFAPASPTPATTTAAGFPPRLAVTVGARIHLVDVAAIERVDAHANYVELHLGGRSLVLRETLSNLEARLDPRRFLRVHRSHLVQLDAIVEAHPQESGRFALRLRSGARVTSGRSHGAKLRAALGLD
jgi:two-component system LytT family response regulator